MLKIFSFLSTVLVAALAYLPFASWVVLKVVDYGDKKEE